MELYIIQSLETHLFFGRIMKEHSLFLEAGFPAKETRLIRRAQRFREEFEAFLKEVVELSDGIVRTEVLESGEVVTPFTLFAERKTVQYTGIPIDTQITVAEQRLRRRERQEERIRENECNREEQQERIRENECNRGEQEERIRENECRREEQRERVRERECSREEQRERGGRQEFNNRELRRHIRAMNQRALSMLSGLIRLKEETLIEMQHCNLYTFNYPLLIQHIIREARLYQSFIMHLERTGMLCTRDIQEQEVFWNQIMMEHALFIRGLLDPTEVELIATADEFSKEYALLLTAAREADNRAAMEALTAKTREQTEKYRDFKEAGTKGILGCEIASIILPLLADHVLREANHYLRILER